MARKTNTEPKQFMVTSCNHDEIAATLNEVWESGYSPWKILTAVDPDGVRFFTIEATLDMDRYNEADPLPQVRYVAQRCREAKLADALNKIHAMGYDPQKQWSHKNSEGEREFCIVGVLSEARYVDPKQEKLFKFEAVLDMPGLVEVSERPRSRSKKETVAVGDALYNVTHTSKVAPIEAARFRKAAEPAFDTPSRRRAKPKPPEVPA